MLCDARLRTSAEGLWAAGDMCEYDSLLHGRPVRIEHEEHASAQGAHAARAMLGAEAPFTEVPYFWTDLADWASLEHVGGPVRWEREEVDGTVGDGPFGVRYLDADGQLVAAVSADGGGDLDAAKAQLAARAAG